MSQTKKPWWLKNPGLKVQQTYSLVESYVLQVIEDITFRDLGVRDIIGTRIIKRIGEHTYRGNMQLNCLWGTETYRKIEFCLKEKDNFDSVEIVVACEDPIKPSSSIRARFLSKFVYTRLFHKVNCDDNKYRFEEIPLAHDTDEYCNDLWGGKTPTLYDRYHDRVILHHIQMDKHGVFVPVER